MTWSRAGNGSVLLLVACLALVLLAILVFLANSKSGTAGVSSSAPSGSAPTGTAAGPTGPENPGPAGATQPTKLAPFGLPQSTRPLEILDKTHFAIGYDDDALEPAWVVYALSGPIVEHGHEKRPGRFATDTAVAHPSQHEDYSHSGFDRGHMCPAFAEWSRFGTDGMTATFITSNIIPQVHALNAGRWEDLESCIAGRDGMGDGWAGAYGTVWVIDGPVFAGDARRLPAGEKIPSACYMIILRQDSGAWDDVAVEMPNQDISGDLSDYLVTVRRIEGETGLSFFTALDATARARLEDNKPTALWPHENFDARHRHR